MTGDSPADSLRTVTPPVTFEPPAEADWHRMIAEAAFFLARERGFRPGHELEDWLQAEENVRKLLSP